MSGGHAGAGARAGTGIGTAPSTRPGPGVGAGAGAATDAAAATGPGPGSPGGSSYQGGSRNLESDGATETQPLTCLITGATSGIGEAVAHRLAASGHRLALNARSADRLAALAAVLPTETLAVPGDVTKQADVEAMFAATESEFGPVDVLILSAGAGISAPLPDTTDADWARMLDLNLTAPFRCMRRALPAMAERGFGRIVVVASIAGKIGEGLIAAYTASKHGVLGLVRSAAAEYARTGVTINAVCPAYVDTPMTDATIASIAARTGRSAAEARAVLERKQPIRRLIRPNEVAAAVAMCLDNPAITGQGINVDGGAVQS